MTTAWEYIKKYWQILVGFAIAIITVFAFRKKADPAEILENANESHEKEIDAIKKSEELLKNKSEKAEYIYKKALEEIEERHEEGQEALSKNMRKEVKRIIEDHEEDPREITRRISELTGFTVHVEDS
tara:strand:- start:821 stop:1204 length:384 start_codon:yes stop_codon:yes gene_type:complete